MQNNKFVFIFINYRDDYWKFSFMIISLQKKTMTQTLLEESKLLNRTSVSEENTNYEDHALITTTTNNGTIQDGLKFSKTPIEKCSYETKVSDNLYTNGDLQNKESYGNVPDFVCLKDIDKCLQDDKDKQHFKHLYPQVLVQGSHEFSDIDSDEEDFELRHHRKSDSGQGSSVETSSLKSNPHDFFQVDISFDEKQDYDSIDENDALDHVLKDSEFSMSDSQQQGTSRRHSSLTKRTNMIVDSKENSGSFGTDFTDIPLNTPSPAKAVNSYTPSKAPQSPSSSLTPLKPPSVTDTPPKQGYVLLCFSFKRFFFSKFYFVALFAKNELLKVFKLRIRWSLISISLVFI